MERSKAFGIFVVILTLAVMTTLFFRGVALPALSDVIFWIALLAASELLPVSLGFKSEVTMGFPIHIALIVLFPPAVAMGIAGVGAVDVREARRELPLWRALFNRAQVMLAVAAAGMVIHGRQLSIFLVIAAALSHMVVNLGQVAIMICLMNPGLSFRKSLRGLLPDPIGGFWVSYAILTGLGIIAAVTVISFPDFGRFAVAAFFIPLFFARLSILGARAQQELSERVRKQQQSLLEATEKVFQEREEERKRIAEQIHDSSLQMLAAAAYGCGNAVEFLDAGRLDYARETVESAREAIDGAMRDLRGNLVDLRRSSVEQGGLVETIRNYIAQVRTLWGREVRVEGAVDNEPPIPVALAAFQILQEGLVNALKHSNGSKVVVKINDEDGRVHIIVEDQGPGFDPTEEAGSEHVGMRLMRERAARVGGSIKLDSSPGSGTRLEAILPGGVGL